MKTTKFRVKKHECASCSIVMEGICEDTPGVRKATVNVRTKTLIIEHEEEVELEALANALEKEGYPVELHE